MVTPPFVFVCDLQHTSKQSRNERRPLRFAHLLDDHVAVNDDFYLSFCQCFSPLLNFPEKKARKKRNTLFCHENVLRL
jgi:hypothetical protein